MMSPQKTMRVMQAPKASTRSRVVPFKRELRKGDIGPDVLACKRALVKAGTLTYPPADELTRQFGERMLAGLKRFQRQVGITVDGIYGLQSHKKLMPYFDAWGAHLMGLSKGTQPAITPRQAVVVEATWGYNVRSQIHYAQVRPMRTINMGHQLPQTLDCSEFATVVYRRANCPDPNGPSFLFNGYGYTGSLSARGTTVSLTQARPGDLVFYGNGWPWHHVAVYAGFGRVISHGSEGGPYLVPVDYRSDRGLIRSYLL